VTIALVLSDVLISRWCADVEGPLAGLLRRGSVIPLAVTVVLLLGAVELNRLFQFKVERTLRVFAYLMIAVLALTPWLSAAGWLGHGAAQVEGLYWPLVWVFTAVIVTGVLTVLRKDSDGALQNASATMFTILYLGFLGSFAVQLRCGRDIVDQDGAWLLLIVILVTRTSDIGAFFVGSAWGRHKLAPRVSPGKTIEGMVGGLLSSCALAVLIVAFGLWAASRIPAEGLDPLAARLLTLVDDLTRSFRVSHDPAGISPFMRAALLGLALSAAGQFGDLIESSFKRDAGVKDSGALIPRFGGILDLVDSPLVAVPIAWFLLTAVWGVV
jgi:CDP-diglyceride synthetase